MEIVIIDIDQTGLQSTFYDDYQNKYPQIKVYRTESTHLGAAKDLGLSVAHGDYIYFLDIRNLTNARTINTLHKIAVRNNLDICIKKKKRRDKAYFRYSRSQRENRKESVSGDSFYFLFKTEFLRKNKFYFLNNGEENHVFIFKILIHNPVVFLIDNFSPQRFVMHLAYLTCNLGLLFTIKKHRSKLRKKIKNLYFKESFNRLQRSVLSDINKDNIKNYLLVQDERSLIKNKIVLMLDLNWFGFNPFDLVGELTDENITFISIPVLINKCYSNKIKITEENFCSYSYKSFTLLEICEYEILVILELDNIQNVNLNKPKHLKVINDIFNKTIDHLDIYEEFLHGLNPELIIYPQGYIPPSNILRFLSIKNNIKTLAIENTCNPDRMVFEKDTGVTTTYNSILKNYNSIIIDHHFSSSAKNYWQNYLLRSEKNKHSEHMSPTRKFKSPVKYKKTIVFLGQVGTDSAVLFGLNGFNSTSEILCSLAALISDETQLIIKLHPKEFSGSNPISHEKYKKLTYRKLKNSNFFKRFRHKTNIVIDHGNKLSTLELIKQSDLCITINSQSGLEAACIGVPVVICGNSFYESDSIVYSAKKPQELEKLLSEFYQTGLKSKKLSAQHFFYFFMNFNTVERTNQGLKNLITSTLSQ